MLFIGLLTLFRLIYASQLGLAQDESYYWQWSRHPDYSYYDQGPGIAYAIRLGTLLLGDTAIGIRLLTVLAGAGTTWFAYLTARRWLGESAAWWTVLLSSVAPLFAVGSIIATYDGLQVFFWTVALYALTRTLEEGRTSGWYLVGVLVGLGSLCKLPMFFFAPGVLLFLLLSPAHRRWLATPHPYLAFLLAVALFTPVLYWNWAHDWIGFLHAQTLSSRHRGVAPLRWTGDFFAGQLLFTGPAVFLAQLYALYRLCRAAFVRNEEREAGIPAWNVSPDAARFLLSFFLPTLLICLYTSLKSKLEINWPAPMHVTALMAVGAWFAIAWEKRRRAWPLTSLVTSTILIVIAFFPDLPVKFGARIPAKTGQKLNETYGWGTVMSYIQQARERLEAEGKPVFIAGINYRANSVLAFHLKGKPETHGLYLKSRRDQYWVWQNTQRLIGHNALLCFDDKNPDAVALARRYFAEVEALEPVSAYRPGYIGPVKTWYVYLCRDFKGYDPEAHVDGF